MLPCMAAPARVHSSCSRPEGQAPDLLSLCVSGAGSRAAASPWVAVAGQGAYNGAKSQWQLREPRENNLSLSLLLHSPPATDCCASGGIFADRLRD